MSGAELMTLPKCPVHGYDMMFRPAGTYEQDYCGSWYDCPEGGCVCSVLIPSPEVERINRERKVNNA